MSYINHKDFAGVFMKFGEYEHLKAFREEGLLYCNPITYFTEIEDQSLRGDNMEDITQMIYFKDGTVAIGPPNEEVPADAPQLPFKDFNLISRHAAPFGNLFCMTAVNLLDKPMGEIFRINERMKEFGKHFLYIHDSSAFMQRLGQKLKESKLHFETGLVEYKDFNKYTGSKSVFQKHNDFAYQQEWRLFIRNNNTDHIKITIGSLEDISVIGSSENIEHLIIKGAQKDQDTFINLANFKPATKEELGISS